MALGIELTIIALLALLGGIIAVRFKQPPVLGLLLTGAIAGPHALGYVSNEELLHLSINAGAFLLLFLIGMEFSLSHLLQSGPRVILIALIKLGAVFLASQGVALLLGFDNLTALVIGVILSITSTVIFLKILEQKGLEKRKEVSLLVGVLILEDIFGIFALTFFSSFESAADITPWTIFGRLAFSLAILGLAYMFLAKGMNTLVEWLTRYSTDETFVFISICIASGLGAIAYLFGLSAAVGAFLAGNIVSSLKNAERFEKPMHPFIFVFTSLFFFSIGSIVDFSVIADNWEIIVVFAFVSITIKFLATGFAMYLLSDTGGRGAIFSGISMVSLGEFSLLLAAEANALVPMDLVSITAAIIFISTLAMGTMVTRMDATYSFVLRVLPRTVRNDLDASATYLRLVSARMRLASTKGKLIFEWRKIANNLLGIVFIGALLWLWQRSTGFRYIKGIQDALFSSLPPLIIFGIIGAILIFPTFRLIRSFRHFLGDFSSSIAQTYPKEIANSKRIYRNILIIAVLFVLSILIPPLFSLIGLSALWATLSIPLLIILILLFFNSESLAKEIKEHEHEGHGKEKGVHHHKEKKG